jgi:hypothetical protein
MLLDPVPDYNEAGPIERHGLMAKLADQLHLRPSRTRQKSPSRSTYWVRDIKVSRRWKAGKLNKKF